MIPKGEKKKWTHSTNFNFSINFFILVLSW